MPRSSSRTTTGTSRRRPCRSGGHAADGWNRATGKRRRRLFRSPVVLLALYSIAGIALIVLAVNLVSGSFRGGDAPRPVPAADREPAATAAATPTPVATPAVSDFELAQREAANRAARRAAITAEQRAVRAA